MMLKGLPKDSAAFLEILQTDAQFTKLVDDISTHLRPSRADKWTPSEDGKVPAVEVFIHADALQDGFDNLISLLRG